MLDRLTLDQLRILIEVAESGSFSAAARRLRRVQSAISQSVQTLELELGLQLFDRAGKCPVLTDAGRVLVEDARQLVHGAMALRAKAESIVAKVEPELKLAVEQMFPNEVIMAALRGLQERFPNLPVTLFTEGLGSPDQRVREGQARIGIQSPFRPEDSEVTTEYLASIPIIPVVAVQHPLAQERGPISREKLDAFIQLTMTDRAQVVRPVVTGAPHGPYSWRFADQNTRLEYLLAGFGWCHVPVHLAKAHVLAGRLKRLNLATYAGGHLTMPMCAIHLRRYPIGKAGRWLIEDLRRRMGESRSDYEELLRDSHPIEARLVPV